MKSKPTFEKFRLYLSHQNNPLSMTHSLLPKIFRHF
jgi:hypothetical protein